MYRKSGKPTPYYFTLLLYLCRQQVYTRQRLRCASTSSLDVPRTRLSTIGDRAFPVAAARLWNILPLNVTSASSLSVFRKHLKTHLFSHPFFEFPVVPVQWLCHFGHYNRSCYLLAYLHSLQWKYSQWRPKNDINTSARAATVRDSSKLRNSNPFVAVVK